MLVKICGITTLEAAKAAEEAGVDFIGFVFAPSKRRISPDAAADIAKHLSPAVKKVGVFVNETKENIEQIAKMVGLDYIQLHGDEDARFALELGMPVIKAFPIEVVSDETLRAYPCEFYVIDSPGTTYRGGSGNVFDWSRLERLNIDRRKLILAGGLNEQNVAKAISAVRPVGVDVSSGVETNGKKDVGKIKRFVQAAKNVDV